MQCPICHHDSTNVIDSRSVRDGMEIRRRRECSHCEQRFTTYERVDSVFPMVIKKDDSREPFQAEKVKAGVMRATEKRPVSVHDVENLVQEVFQWVIEQGEKEIQSSLIGQEVMNRLKSLDTVAYVRFASVYRQFKDINDFMSELSSILTKKSDK